MVKTIKIFLFLTLLSFFCVFAENSKDYSFRFMTSTIGWKDGKNPKLEGNFNFNEHHGLGVMWIAQNIKIIDRYKTNFYGVFYQFTLKALNLRAGLGHSEATLERSIIINNQDEVEKAEGNAIMLGIQFRYSIFSKIVLGHGIDFFAVDTGNNSNSNDFLYCDISLLEIGFQF